MNIREIVEETDAYNLHTHTQFCDGRTTMDRMAAAALEAGVRHLGFSPHSPVPIVSPCNMAESDLAGYREEIEKLRKEYAGRMDVYMGVEIDYLGDEWNAQVPLFGTFGFDYTISSVHFIPNRRGEYVDIDGRFERFKERMSSRLDNDIRYVVETFYEQSHKMLDKGGFDILGHFDKIAQNASYYDPGIEDEVWYNRLVDNYIDHIIESGVIVEVNTKAREDHGRFFPAQRHWEHLARKNVCMVVNSDAHYAERITQGREEALECLKKVRGGH